jgi:hypothetical protein
MQLKWNSSKNSIRTRLLRNQSGQCHMIKHIGVQRSRDPSVDRASFVLYCTWKLTLHYADSRYSSLCGKTSQGRLASPAEAVVPNYSPLSSVLLLIIRRGYRMKSMKVTLHGHHTPSLLLSNDLRSTPWQDIWVTSELQWIHQGDAHDFSNIKTQAIIKYFFFCKTNRRRNSRYSHINISLFPSCSG